MARRVRKTPSRSSAPPERDYAAIATRYAQDVAGGRKVPAPCKWVVLACKRHLADLKREKFPYRFDTAKVGKVCRFVENLPHTAGDWAKRGELLHLQPWQIFIVASIFGWLNRETGRRRFERVYVEVPRKNGKSNFAAAIALYMGSADGEEGAEVYCGATSEEQAWKVFLPVKRMVQRTPDLRAALGLEALAASVTQERTGSFIQTMIGKPGDGDSPHCAVVDEYHEHPTSEQLDAMRTGMGARSQPLLLVITTAGVDLASACYDLHLEACNLLQGIGDAADEFFTIIYTIDEDDDWTKEDALWKANPNAGVSVDMDRLRKDQRQAINNPQKSGTFRTKHLNQWMQARRPYFDIVSWLGRCAKPGLTLEDFYGELCVVFLDLASKRDLAAMLMLFRREGLFYTIPRFWLPEALVDSLRSVNYRAWSEQKHLVLTPGNIIDFAYIEDELRALKSKVELREVAYDPFQATYLATRLLAEGFPMVEYGATVKNFSEPMKALDALILQGKILHDGNPVLAWNLSNVQGQLDKKDNIFPTKERPESKIDGGVALIGALGRWLGTSEEKFVDPIAGF